MAHQGDVYSGSFASAPHVIRVLASDPLRASAGYFRFSAWVEICRQRHGIRVPDELADAYFQSLKELADLVGAASSQDWDLDFLGAAMSALAVSKGFALIGEAAQELDEDTSEQFLKLLEIR